MGSSVIRKMKREQARALASGGAAAWLNARLDRIEAMAQEALQISLAVHKAVSQKFPEAFEKRTESGLVVPGR